jgi:hypothetical protein
VSSGPSSPRRQFLRNAQNADGGWGYFPGKHSWLEPTVYATLALRGDPESATHVEKAWKLIRSWALPQGGWRMSADVPEAHWSSALCINLYATLGVCDSHLVKTVDWTVQTVGAEGGLLFRVGQQMNPTPKDCDYALQGWPWRPHTSSWVEPTAHTIVALNKAAAAFGNRLNIVGLRTRVDMAERMLLDRRCQDGAWNYGNRKVLRNMMASFPETTALALLGLQTNRRKDVQEGLEVAHRYWREIESPLAIAWLTVCLRNYGIIGNDEVPARAPRVRPSRDILLAAIQCFGEPGGAISLLGAPAVPAKVSA